MTRAPASARAKRASPGRLLGRAFLPALLPVPGDVAIGDVVQGDRTTGAFPVGTASPKARRKPPNQARLRGAYGIRTRAAAVRGRCPRPLDECAPDGGSV